MDTQQATARRHVESYSPNDVTLPPGGELPLMPLLLNLSTTDRLNYTRKSTVAYVRGQLKIDDKRRPDNGFSSAR
jgi:hypothetical protein